MWATACHQHGLNYPTSCSLTAQDTSGTSTNLATYTYWYEPKPEPEWSPHREQMREISSELARLKRAVRVRLPAEARRHHRTGYQGASRLPGYRGSRPR